jgi:hypothetical protein
VQAKYPPHRQASSYTRRSGTFAVASTEQGLRSRRLRLASPRLGAPGLLFLRREEAGQRKRPAGARSTPMRRVNTSARLAVGLAYPARSRGFWNASHEARYPAARYRARLSAPPPAAPPVSAPRLLARR